MPADRSNSSPRRSGGSSGRGAGSSRPRRPSGGKGSGGKGGGKTGSYKGGSGKSGGSGTSGGRRGGDGKSGRRGTGGGRRDGAQGGGDGKGGGGQRRDRDGRRRRDDRGRTDDRAPRRPKTEAERRAAEVAARRGPRPRRDPDAEQRRIEERTTDRWIDEGSTNDEQRLRAAAAGATRRATKSGQPTTSIDPADKRALTDALGGVRGERVAERLDQAATALDRERFQEARRVAAGIAKEVPDLSAAHQILGLANYRLGYWKPAATALERANELHSDPTMLPVLADCYRALRRWAAVDRTWLELRAASPAHEVLAEGRIVAAGAQADRGDLRAALETMQPAGKTPKVVRDHHLRQWYVLGDLSDRVGDPIAARRWFSRVADHDPAFADVDSRLRGLGR
ncbi:MAG: hypothetical protein AAGA42_12400 [Actinomycetota bacterium]